MDGISGKDRTTVLEDVAARIIGFDVTALSPTALRVAKAGITDTVGVTLAGLPEPCTQILLSTPGVADAPGPCRIFATRTRTSALDATLVNGVASHALDFDDFSDVLGGHQSVPLVPVLFALADEHGLSGETLLSAYVVGFETEHRFARALHPHHYDKGWHPTATLGIFGTVAASARALGMTTAQTTNALAIAASMASGLKANFGTMTKPLHVGHSGRSGLLAALLARNGFEANPGAMEEKQGFFNVFNGPGMFDPSPLVSAWSGPLDIEAPSIGLKQFPCCGSTHHAITAMLRLVKSEGITAGDVAGIDILTHQRRLAHTNTPHPASVLQAKFSVQYAVVRALLDGAVGLKDFEGEAFLETDIRQLLDITTAKPFPDGGGNPWDAEVVVSMKDGRRLTKRIDNMVGRSGADSMTLDEIGAKFTDCASRVLPTAQIAPALAALTDLEKQTDVRSVVTLLSLE